MKTENTYNGWTNRSTWLINLHRARQRDHIMNKLHFSAFLRGYWDSVQFGYVPDYDADELQVWAAGLQWGNAGNGEPTVDDFDELCDIHY